MTTQNPVKLFLANWAASAVNQSVWHVDITRVGTQLEQRRLSTDKPYRTQTVNIDAIDSRSNDGAQLDRFLRQRSENRVYVPLYSDFVKLTSQANSGSTVLNVTTTKYRRFGNGRRVMLCRHIDDGARTRWSYELAVITSFTDTTITLTAPTSSTFTAGCRVYACIESETKLDPRLQQVTDMSAGGPQDFVEVPGALALPTAVSPGSLPAWATSISGLPLWEPSGLDWGTINQGYERRGQITQVGLDTVPSTEDDESVWAFDATFVGRDRASSWTALEMFDSRGGSAFPFWFVAPSNALKLSSVGPNYVSVQAATLALAEGARLVGLRLAMRRSDGPTTIHVVSSVATVGSETRLTISNFSSPPSLSTIGRVSIVRLVRFDSDTFTETWETSERLSAQFKVIELQRDGDLEATGTHPEIPNVAGTDTDLPPWDQCSDDCVASDVTAPMYVVECDGCDELLPVYTGAPLNLPAVITVKVRAVSKDSSSPVAGALSELIARMNGSQWRLERDNSLDQTGGTSRHFHHLRTTSGPAWSFTSQSVTRKGWSATSSYSVSGVTKHIECRLYAEWSSDTSGVIGLHVVVHFFSDEIRSTYVDGTAFTDGITYTRADPVVYSGGVRHMHPQLVLTASIPTKMESPCQYAWAGPGTPPPCRIAKAPGVPWMSGTAADMVGSSVFDTATREGTITLGGGCPTSDLLEYLVVFCYDGLTPLKVDQSGFDNTNGGLTFNSDLTITRCLPTQDEVDCCDGDNRPTGCITLTQPWSCCLKSSTLKNVVIKSRCVELRQTYDSGCGVISQDKNVRGYLRTVDFALKQCNISGDPSTWYARWSYAEDDPDFVFHNYHNDFDSDDGQMTAAVGTNVVIYSRLKQVSVAGSGFIRGLNVYAGYSSYADFEIRAQGVGFDDRKHLLMGRFSGFDYYAVEFDWVAKSITVYRSVSGVVTMIGQLLSADITFGDEMYMKVQGGLVVGAVNVPLGTLPSSIPASRRVRVNDCDPTTGEPRVGPDGSVAWGTTDTSASAAIGYFDVRELCNQKVEATVELDSTGWAFTVPAGLLPGYIACADDPDNGCGSDVCSCTTGWSRVLYPGSLSASGIGVTIATTDDPTKRIQFLAPPGTPHVEFTPFTFLSVTAEQCSGDDVRCTGFDYQFFLTVA